MDAAFALSVNGRHCLSVVIILISAIAGVACQKAENDEGTDRSSAGAPDLVYTVNYPLAWMAETIGGDQFQVKLPVPAGVDPAHWLPSPEVILAYQRADVILLNGAGYAGWVQFASLSPGRLVDTTRGMEARFLETGAAVHTHGPEGEHDHSNIASHTWLDPTLALEQAAAVAGALRALAPDHEAEFDKRREILQAELGALDGELAAALQPRRSAGILYSHPVYDYLDARYELDGRALTWEPDEDPGDAEWARLSSMLQEQPATIMIWEAPPMASTAERLRHMGVEPIVFETGAVRPAEGDYLALMRANLDRLAAR